MASSVPATRSTVVELRHTADSLEELVLQPHLAQEAQAAWTQFAAIAKSPEAAGELIYAAIFDGAPGLQALFTSPRAVQAMRFVASLNNLVMALDEPAKLKVLAETLGFGHLNLDVTEARVGIFRDAILELLAMELGEKISFDGLEGWRALLDYAGGAIIFCRAHYSSRLEKLLESWNLANGKGGSLDKAMPRKELGPAEEVQEGSSSEINLDLDAPHEMAKERAWRRMMRQITPGSVSSAGASEPTPGRGSAADAGGPATHVDTDHSAKGGPLEAGKHFGKGQTVPTTFTEMFQFNAAVMGLRSISWQKEVLSSFDNIVRNVANSIRLQEECEVVALRISKRTGGTVNLAEFKSCMLAALRSLLPKVWDGSYEVAWSWLWENVERVLKKTLGQPVLWEKQLESMMASLGEDTMYEMRRETYDRFFQLAPAGQDYFRQSNTRLHYIAAKVSEMVLELYRDPWNMVSEISGIGLRHVGYGIPVEHIGPFVTACVEIFSKSTEDRIAAEAYRWSLGLISKMMVRTIQEGSTIVMKAVNANSEKLLKNAISCAPRGSRAEWVLNVQVGIQKISPLFWAIESGSLEAAGAILTDLLTIRADRDRYYYGVDALFERHEDIVSRLVDMARPLLSMLFEGLVWRSRHTTNGTRRVNYFVKHLVVDNEGALADALKSLAASRDQTIISHPVISLVSDTLWNGVVRRQFILSKIGFLVSLLVFMLCQAILPKLGAEDSRAIRIAIFAGRVVNYTYSMTRLAVGHTRQWARAFEHGNTVRILRVPVPTYLRDFYMALSFTLMVLLAIMSVHEPMFYCIGRTPAWPSEDCDRARDVEGRYIVLSMSAMIIHWLLLVDMAVFATKLSAFVLVCQHVLSEVGRFLIAMLFLLVTFSSAITCLRHNKREFNDVPNAANCLFAITVGLYEGDFREFFTEPTLLAVVFLFVTVSVILLINLLIAQLNCSYEYVYADMVGFARLTRAQLIVDTLPSCPGYRWSRFVATLRFEQPVEFDEGDVGLPGAIQVKEPASLNPVVIDSIKRYGGTCSPEMQWPDNAGHDEEDRFEKIERLLQSAYNRLVGAHRPAAGDASLGESKIFSSTAGSEDLLSSSSSDAH